MENKEEELKKRLKEELEHLIGYVYVSNVPFDRVTCQNGDGYQVLMKQEYDIQFNQILIKFILKFIESNYLSKQKVREIIDEAMMAGWHIRAGKEKFGKDTMHYFDAKQAELYTEYGLDKETN